MILSRSSLIAAAAVLVGAALIGWPMIAAGAWVALLAAFAAIAIASVTIVIAQTGPALALCMAIALTLISGHWSQLGAPLPLDRFAMAIAFAALLLRRDLQKELVQRLLQPVSILLGLVAAYAIASAAAADTLATSDGLFGLLDSLGLIPFVLYVSAPVVFRTRRDRNILLCTLVAIGGYLGVTAFFEIAGFKSLIMPSYITDSAIERHLGRARGPFLESAANGLALYACGAAAAVAAWEWRRVPLAQACAAIVICLCASGVLFTLTRAIWLASALATLIILLAIPTLRRFSIPALAAAVVVAAIGLGAVPGLADKASQRSNDLNPVWDRLNTNAAALRMVEDQPLFGVGWSRFTSVSPDYMRQADGYPLTGVHIPVHNVFLSRAAELGLIGALLWLGALATALYVGMIRAGPPELRPWQIGFTAIAIHWLIVANFVPLTFAFPNALLWLWAGLVSVPARNETEAVDRPRAGARLSDPATI